MQTRNEVKISGQVKYIYKAQNAKCTIIVVRCDCNNNVHVVLYDANSNFTHATVRIGNFVAISGAMQSSIRNSGSKPFVLAESIELLKKPFIPDWSDKAHYKNEFKISGILKSSKRTKSGINLYIQINKNGYVSISQIQVFKSNLMNKIPQNGSYIELTGRIQSIKKLNMTTNKYVFFELFVANSLQQIKMEDVA